MAIKKQKKNNQGLALHPKNRHIGRYDLTELAKTSPDLKSFIIQNEYGNESIVFANPEAVKSLNKSLLLHYYDLQYWDIPEGYLCPPIPGRADYIHHIAELLGSCNKRKVPKGKDIKVLDIGVGANCVYPIIGVKEYNWSFIGAEIEEKAFESASRIIDQNDVLRDQVELRKQNDSKDIFKGIIQEGELIELTICNPPFHTSQVEAIAGTQRKVRNLKTDLSKAKEDKPTLNFGGQSNELWCLGGEKNFITNMIYQSKDFAKNCMWFSTLVSKESNLKDLYKTLNKVKATDVKTIVMGVGNKRARVLAWTFLEPKQMQLWVEARWRK